MRTVDSSRSRPRGSGFAGWLRVPRGLAGDAASRTREESRQRLRLKRFLLASAFSIVYLLVLSLFHTQGKVDVATLVEAAVIVVVLISTFFGIFRLGLNSGFADPSLTTYQVLAAVFTMLYVVYRAPDTRIVFATFFFVALMFGMLRSDARRLAILGVISLMSFAIATLARYAGNHDVEVLRIDMLQLCVTAVALPWFIFIGNRVKRFKEADRRKDEFLATLAHELRNPLAPIRMGAQILRMAGTDSPGKSVLPMMERQLQHLTRLLDDLLDVSRITRGKVALRVERIDLRHAIQAAIETSRPAIEEMHHVFAASLPDQPLWVDADPIRIAQVISNVLTNAARYTPQGGRIALKAERRGSEVEVLVNDTGYGIPPERLESIFDMFTQLESPIAKPAGGLGIGLSLAKGLVALHHGTIEARSEGPGKGSEFRVRLPAAPTRADDVATAASEAIRMNKQKILVVDDNRDAASSLATFLELTGHDVRVAHDGEDAIRASEEFRPHTVLLDLGMPGVDGYEACRRIRETATGKNMRIIAVTGWGQEDDRRKALLAGFDMHLVKPVSPDTLIQLLEETGVHETTP